MATLSSDGLQTLLGAVGVEGIIPSFPLADIQNSPMGIYLSYLAEILVQLTECEPQIAYESIQWPNEVGDLVVVLPRLRLKDANSQDLATELMERFPKSSIFDPPFNDGINLRVFFSPSTLARILLPYIIDRGPLYGKDQSAGLREPDAVDSGRKKIVVEFSSPNIGKEFDGNHLRSTIIGACIASQYESMGWDVLRMNFLGDWGKHIGLLAVGWPRFGSEELFEADPLRHLLDVFTKIDGLLKVEQDTAKKLRADGQDNSVNETGGISEEKDAFFKKMEDGDPDALALWKRFRDVCVAHYVDLYARLNISFDIYSGESDVSQETIAEVESILKEKGVYEDSDAAWIVDFKKHGSKGLGVGIARYRNGTTSYLLRDIAAVLERSRKYSFDKMIYVVSARQDSHFQQIFTALELIGYSELASRLLHISFGRVQGLSPKQGSGLLLGDTLDQCQTAIQEFLKTDQDKIKRFLETDQNNIKDFDVGDSKTSEIEQDKIKKVEGGDSKTSEIETEKIKEAQGRDSNICEIEIDQGKIKESEVGDSNIPETDQGEIKKSEGGDLNLPETDHGDNKEVEGADSNIPETEQGDIKEVEGADSNFPVTNRGDIKEVEGADSNFPVTDRCETKEIECDQVEVKEVEAVDSKTSGTGQDNIKEVEGGQGDIREVEGNQDEIKEVEAEDSKTSEINQEKIKEYQEKIKEYQDKIKEYQHKIKELESGDSKTTEVVQGKAKEVEAGDSKTLDTLTAIALMTQDLSARRMTNFAFDITKMATAEGYTGLSLQHWLARFSSKLKGVTIDRNELESTNYSIFEQEEYADVLRLLVQFPNIVKASFKSLESSSILTYLFRLSDLLPTVWNEEESEGSHRNLAQLAFYESVRQVLENGMRIVGLVPMKL